MSALLTEAEAVSATHVSPCDDGCSPACLRHSLECRRRGIHAVALAQHARDVAVVRRQLDRAKASLAENIGWVRGLNEDSADWDEANGSVDEDRTIVNALRGVLELLGAPPDGGEGTT